MDVHSSTGASSSPILSAGPPTSLSGAASGGVSIDGRIGVVDSETGPIKHTAEETIEKFSISDSGASFQSIDALPVASAEMEAASPSPTAPIKEESVSQPAVDDSKKTERLQVKVASWQH